MADFYMDRKENELLGPASSVACLLRFTENWSIMSRLQNIQIPYRKTRSACLLLFFTCSVLLSACNVMWKNVSESDGSSGGGFIIPGGNSRTGCNLPPDSFQESDIVGTWRAGWSEFNDTLIIKSNGFYKQIIIDQSTSFSYESEWKRWWLEYGEGGTPYLHLDGMHLCVYIASSDCQSEGGGDKNWYDSCAERIVQMPGKGILAIVGASKGANQPPRGILLNGFQLDPDSIGFLYQLEE